MSERRWDPFPFASCGQTGPWHLFTQLYSEGQSRLWVASWLLQAVLPCSACGLYCCRGTLLRDTPWAKARLSWFAQRLRTCRWVLASPHVLHCATFLHWGHLALLGELLLRYPAEWQSMGIAHCLLGCRWNSPALFLPSSFHCLTVVVNTKQMFSVSK